MSTDTRFAILNQFEHLSSEQRARKLHHLDVMEAALDFGIPLAVQMEKDKMTGYKAWDSFSMILQSSTLLPSDFQVERFRDWAMKQLIKNLLTE